MEFWVFVLELDPQDIGFRQARPRLWLICLPVSDFGSFDKDRAETIVMGAITLFCSVASMTAFHFEELLLVETHPIIVEYRDLCRRMPYVVLTPPTKKQQHIRNGKVEIPWAETHVRYCEEHNVDNWWMGTVPPHEVQDMHPCLRSLRPREFDVLRMAHSVVSFPEQTARIINVSQRIGQGAERTGAVGGMTITSSWRCFHTSKCRLLKGIEGFHLQGIHYGSRHRLLRFEDEHFLCDLAGNAFHCWVAALVMLATLVLKSEVAHSNGDLPMSRNLDVFDVLWADSDDDVEHDQ